MLQDIKKNIACRNFFDFETTRYIPTVIRSRLKTSKTMSFNDLCRFCSMPNVALMTPGTADVRISNAAQRKLVEYKTVIKIGKLNIDQMINKATFPRTTFLWQ